MTITTRIDAVTKIPAAWLAAAPPAPRSVKVELTGRCNLRCSFCALRTRQVQPKGDMDFDLFRRITREMKDAGVEEIGVFYLGESCSAPDLLVRAISHVKLGLGFEYCFLTTNGTLMTPGLADACMASGLDSMKFSINAADPQQFAEVMGVKPRLFDDALKNLASVKAVRDDNHYPCGLYASSILYDGEQAEKMEKMLEERVRPFVDEHYFLPLYGQMTHWNEDRKASLGYTPTAGNQGRIGALRDPLPCWSVMTEGHVTADGILTSCCFDSDGTFAMGDLKTTPFMEAWHSASFQELRKAHIKKDVAGTICEGCLAYA